MAINQAKKLINKGFNEFLYIIVNDNRSQQKTVKFSI